MKLGFPRIFISVLLFWPTICANEIGLNGTSFLGVALRLGSVLVSLANWPDAGLKLSAFFSSEALSEESRLLLAVMHPDKARPRDKT